jgi:hypothetical protein
MRWRNLHRVGATLALGWACALVGACGDDPPPDDDDCTVGDPLEGPTCECSGTSCVCPSSGDCGIHCITDCDLQCAGSGSCDFDCTTGCDVACTGSGNCDVEVGGDSNVECTGSGDCDVTCTGDCTVKCPGSATCTVRCADDAACNVESCSGEVTSCPENVQVCNGGCS